VFAEQLNQNISERTAVGSLIKLMGGVFETRRKMKEIEEEAEEETEEEKEAILQKREGSIVATVVWLLKKYLNLFFSEQSQRITCAFFVPFLQFSLLPS
jgi:hypothetical protein